MRAPSLSSSPTVAASRRIFARTLAALSLLYPACLLSLLAFLSLVGEHFWLSGVLLYLPRWLFALPLPFLGLGLVLVGRAALLWTQALSLVILLFPLGGLELPLLWPPQRASAPLRVLSCNANNGLLGHRELVQDVLSVQPDLIVFQELVQYAEPMLELLRPHFAYTHFSTQFLLASRHPFAEVREPGFIEVQGRQRSARYIRYRLDTPLGSLALYNVHTVSPRSAFYTLRGQGFRREILSGRLFAGENAGEMQDRSAHRDAQIQSAVAAARREPEPVLLLGDLNLPSLSTALRHLEGFQDGFVAAGVGFGYTFPANKRWVGPFLRLDRIFASEQLVFLGFQVLPTEHSDHFCVYADVARR